MYHKKQCTGRLHPVTQNLCGVFVKFNRIIMWLSWQATLLFVRLFVCPVGWESHSCYNLCIARRNRVCSASDSAYSYTFLRSMVCLSVVCLSHSCTLIKSLDGCICYFAGTLVGYSDTLRQMEVPDPPGEGEIWGSNSQPKHAVASDLWKKVDWRFTRWQHQSGSPPLPPNYFGRFCWCVTMNCCVCADRECGSYWPESSDTLGQLYHTAWQHVQARATRVHVTWLQVRDSCRPLHFRPMCCC